MSYPIPYLQQIGQWFMPTLADARVVPFGSGHINDTYLIDTGELGQQWVLQRINHLIFKAPEILMHNIEVVARHLQQSDYPMKILAPVANLEGKVCYSAPEGGFWRLFPFIEGATTIEEVATPAQAYEAAHAFGLFFKHLSDLPVEQIEVSIPRFHDTLYRYRQLEESIGINFENRCAGAGPEITFLQEQQRFAFLFNELWEQGLPLRITHNDTKINNVLLDQQSGKGLCVIDLDTLMPGTILSDVGDMIRTFCPTLPEDAPDIAQLKIRRPILDALLGGFLDACQSVLTPLEKKHLLDGGLVIVYMQALRFLADYLRGDTYYKINYPHHNLVRTRNQIALLKELMKISE